MSRLPTPGSDDNTWGDILNDYLGVSINTDGTIKTGVIGTAQIADGSITTTDISATAGITKTQFASAVQTSLGKADTALQTVPNATSTAVGGIQLAGDLTGSATSPALVTSGVTAGTYGSNTMVPIFTVDAKGRITAANNLTPPALQTYLSNNTSNTNLGQWTKIANQTVSAQYGDAQMTFMLQNNFDAETDGSVALVRMRTKQQSAFGNNPGVNVSILFSSGAITAASLLAVVTQNTPTTNVDLYLQINEGYRSYLMTPQSVTTGNNGVSQLLNSQAFVATGSLPTGTLQAAGKYDQTNPATSAVTGGIRLAGDIGGTATAPTTPTAVHLTGAETITGNKTFTGTVTVPTPVNTTDATTKTYVDTAVSAVGSGLTQTASQTSNFTAATGKFYPVNATSGVITVTLPTSSGSQFFIVKKTDSSANVVTLSGTINGTASTTLNLTRQNQAKKLIADGGGGWTVALGDLDIVTTLATPTALGFVQLAGDLTGTAASPALAATGVAAGTYGSSSSIPTFTVDSKGRLTSVGSQAVSGAPTYTTSNTGGSDGGKWTKIATQTISVQYQDSEVTLLLEAYLDGETSGSVAQLRLRTKQQSGFGGNPYVEAAIISSTGRLAATNVIAVVTQNSPSSIVDFYIQVNEYNCAYLMTSMLTANTGSATTALLSSQGYVTTASLPSGQGQVAGKYDQTNPASPTLTGGIKLAGDLGGTSAAPLVSKLNGITLNTTAPSAGQVLQATSTTAAAWTTVSTGGTTDNTKVAKSGDTMTGSLTMPNLNSIKTPAPSDIYQWFYSDPTAYNQVPFGEQWHDLLAFGKLYTVTSETTTNGSSWTTGTVNKKIFAHLENQSIQIIDGTTQGARWTFSNMAYSSGRWLMIAYTYIANQPNVTLYVQSSSDGTTWTNRHNSSYTPGVGPIWHYVQDNGGDGYVRIMMQAGAALNISSIRFYTARWGDQGAGKEIEQPYTWNENGYIGIGKGTAAPGYTLDVTGDARVVGQIHNVTDPTAAQDVATKAYVDANAGGGGGSGVTLTTAQTITGAKTFQNDVVVSGSSTFVTLISENQSAAPKGTMNGSANYVSGSYTQLTTASNSLNGELEYIVPAANYGGTIDATFDIWAGGGSGADGVWFYAGSTSTPTYEAAVDGYAVFFNEYQTSQIRLYYGGNQLTNINISNIGDSTWRTMRFTLSSSGAIVVYINGTSTLTYSDSVRTLPGTRWGFGARTGGSNNEHRVRNMTVTTYSATGTPYGITVGATTIRNGKISNVSDPTSSQDAATKAYVDLAASGGSGSVYAVDVNSIGLPIVGANGITVTETASAITIGYSGSGGSSGGTQSIGNANTYTSVSLGTSDGSTNAFTVNSGSFVTLALNNVVSDSYSNYSTSTYLYTVPATGTYMIAGRVRVVDGDTSTANFGIGVHTTNNDGYWFKWNTLPGNTNRKSFDYTRVDNFNQGDKLRFFAYSSSNIAVNTAGLQIIRLDTIGSSGGSSGGNSRTVAQVSSAMTAAATASTDYVYYWSGSTAYALTMPTAVGNTNRYVLKNSSTVSQIVMTTASQTIDGGTTISITPNNSVDLISNGTNWMVI